VESQTIIPDLSFEGGMVGEYAHQLDAKKRLTIPSDWRERVGVSRELFVLPGVNDKCLCVYPAREMTRRMHQFRELSTADREGRRLTRMLAARGDLVVWDGQGRIRVKDSLLEYAQIEEQAMLVGALDHFEMWKPEQWQAEREAVEQVNLAKLAESLGL
jgi:MraZ protein